MVDRAFEVQHAVLSTLTRRGADCRLGRGQYYLSEAVRSQFPSASVPSRDELQQAFWSLIGQGLAFIDMSQSAAENWTLKLTPAGTATLRDEDYNPDDASGYLSKLAKDVPGLGETAIMYLREALRSYTARSYLAATVMLGVASEAAILEMAECLAEHLAEHDADTTLRETLHDPRIPYSRKFQEVRKRLEARRRDLPPDLTDGMSLTFDSILDLLRTNRNDAGHPTGKHFDREDCFIALRMAVRYLKKIAALTTLFRGSSTPSREA